MLYFQGRHLIPCTISLVFILRFQVCVLFLNFRNIIVVHWKSRVKLRDFPVLSARGLLYSFRCLICIPFYTSLNLRGLMSLFGLPLLSTLEGLCHFCICSSVLFNGGLGLSASSKSVTSFPLSSMFCFVSVSCSSFFPCSSPGISTSSGSNRALNWSA